MRIYRTELLGHVLEARRTDLGRQTILLDGRVASDKPFAGLLPSSHFLEVPDAQGTTHHVEVRWIDESKLGLGKYRVVVSVDGVERCRLAPIDPALPPAVCRNCGYNLHGLPVEHGEVQCPECGRHTPAALIDASGSPPGRER